MQEYKYDNLLKRRCRADRPNIKWVTDISYIHTKEGVLYLSMIQDLYDYNHERIQKKTGVAPLRLKRNIPTQGAFCTVRTNWGSSVDIHGYFLFGGVVFTMDLGYGIIIMYWDHLCLICP